MEKANTSSRKSISWYSLFVVGIGISGMVLACTFDFIRHKKLNLGLDQMAGFVVSAIITLSGLRHLNFTRSKIWHFLLLTLYLTGVLFMGLKSRSQSHFHSAGPLQDTGIFFGDVVMNFLGFLPLGYLMIIYLININHWQKVRVLFLRALFTCIGTSFFIELVQYYLPGRTSSLIDLLVNGCGALFGIAYGLLEHRFFTNHLQKIPAEAKYKSGPH